MALFFSLMSLSDQARAEQWTLRCVTTNHALASPWGNVAHSPPAASVKRHFCNVFGKRFSGGYVGNSFLIPSRYSLCSNF